MQLLLYIMKITLVQIEDCIIELGVFLLLSLEVFAETREYNPPPPPQVV